MALRSLLRGFAPMLALSMALVACGSDDDEAKTGDDAAASNEALCTLAQEMDEQDDFPSPAQLQRYSELAPDEISDAVSVAAPPLIDAGGDMAAFFEVVADDDIQASINEINAWETANCEIEHDITPPEQGEIDPDATRVDVVATEYTFAFDTELTAGRTSFVMTNPGAEVHFMEISQLAEGHTMEEALAYEGDPEEGGLVTGVRFGSDLAAPGGEDEEVITADLEPGNWAMLCFIPGPDGTPHAFSGMAIPFTVS